MDQEKAIQTWTLAARKQQPLREIVRQYADSSGSAGGTSIKGAIRLTSVGCPDRKTGM